MPKKTFLKLRDEKQEKVLRSAIHEFVKNGFAGARVSDIAKSAEVAKGSMYQYFEDKKALFVYCAQWSLETFMKKLDERMNLKEMDAFEYFQDNLARTETINEERELMLFMRGVANEPALAAPSMKAMYNAGDLYAEKLIQNSQRKGLVRKDIDAGLLLFYFLAVTERFKTRWLDLYVDLNSEATKEQREIMNNEKYQMLELLKNGMGC